MIELQRCIWFQFHYQRDGNGRSREEWMQQFMVRKR